MELNYEARIRLFENEISKKSLCIEAKKTVTIRLSEDVIAYFKDLAEESDIPYQSLINLYLRDCATHHKKLNIQWPS